MNVFDKFLLSIFMWLGKRWFSTCIVGQDANGDVVCVGFEIAGFDEMEAEYSRYERE